MGLRGLLPVRDDALTVLVWAGQRLHLHLPWALGFVFAGAVIAVAGLRGRQRLDRWAFANCSFTLLSLAALAAATALKRAAPPR